MDLNTAAQTQNTAGGGSFSIQSTCQHTLLCSRAYRASNAAAMSAIAIPPSASPLLVVVLSLRAVPIRIKARCLPRVRLPRFIWVTNTGRAPATLHGQAHAKPANNKNTLRQLRGAGIIICATYAGGRAKRRV